MDLRASYAAPGVRASRAYAPCTHSSCIDRSPGRPPCGYLLMLSFLLYSLVVGLGGYLLVAMLWPEHF